MKTKIYIETTRANFCHQVANHIHSVAKEACKTIFVLKNTKVNPQPFASLDISEIHYADGELKNTLTSLANILHQHNLNEIEVHVEASTASLALLIFCSVFKDNMHCIKPHIYETSVRDYALRSQSQNNAELYKKLSAALNGHAGFVGSIEELMACGYAWHHFTDAAYYITDENINSADLPVRFIAPLTEEQKKIFSNFLCIPDSMIAVIRDFFAQDDVYYCSHIAPRHPSLADTHKRVFAEQLLDIRQRHTGHKFFLLSHNDNDAGVLRAASDHFYQLPPCLPFSAMQWLGITPKNVISSFRDELTTLNNPSNRYIISMTAKEELCLPESELLATFNLSPDAVRYADELATYHREGHVKRIFYSSASMGDIVYGLGAIHALKTRYPEDAFVFVTNKLYAELIDNSTAEVEHWDIHALTADQRFQIELANRFSRLHFFERWEQIVAPSHMTDAFISEVTPDTFDTHKRARLDFEKIDKDPVDRFMRVHNITRGKVVLLHPNIGSPNRTWAEQHWKKLAERFIRAGWQVILIGSDNNKFQNKKTMHIDMPGVINGMNAFTITQTVYLMSLCQLLVACDSGPVALAGYTEIAISALYSIIPSQYRLPYRHNILGWNAQGINVGCQFGQCGHLIMNENFFKHTLHKKWAHPTSQQFSEWCPNAKKYACLAQFSDADWWEHIERFINSEDFILNT